MGAGLCGGSSHAVNPAAGAANNDPEVDQDVVRQKGCGSGVDLDNRPEDDMFAVEDAEAQEFMAIRPWIGQIAEPSSHNPVCNDKPDVTYALEYVYGYRSADSRQNVHWNANGNACYMTAALGVILE